MINAIGIALLVAIVIYIVVLGYELYLKIKENRNKKMPNIVKDLFCAAMISALTEELDKNLKDNNEETKEEK